MPRPAPHRASPRAPAFASLSRAHGTPYRLEIAAAVLLCDPAAIVLGGGVIKCGEPLLGPARAVLRERAFGELPELLTSALDRDAALYGAAAAAVDLLADQPYRPDDADPSS